MYLDENEGYFVLEENAWLKDEFGADYAVDFFLSLAKPYVNLDGNTPAIVLQKNEMETESYHLSIKEAQIQLSAGDEGGILYGLMSLLQLIQKDHKIPCMEIRDKPRFGYRGFMLDEGRHFHGMETVKRMLDIMAILKMNIFHWHLTEDQGWRIGIKAYPKLTIVGSKRERTQVGGILSILIKRYEQKPHQGYYTQDEIREIIEYASKRNITIIPEIDMPGHVSAALAAYPEFGCTGGPYKVEEKFGIFKDVLCVGQDYTYDFVEAILDEICELFPSKIIHIGGDEAPRERWKNCKFCRARMGEWNLEQEEELQHYFTERVRKMLAKRGKILMGWNEILHEKQDRDVIGQHWMRGKDQVMLHLRQGGKMVMSDFFHNYLDYNYHITPLGKTYGFDPIPKGLEEKYHGNVLGIEAPLWTEWVPNLKKLDWQVFPRLVAVAENAWTETKNKNYVSFLQRVQVLNQILDQMNVNYAKLDEVDPSRLKRYLTLFKIFSDRQFD